jgi:hypothetical protein
VHTPAPKLGRICSRPRAGPWRGDEAGAACFAGPVQAAGRWQAGGRWQAAKAGRRRAPHAHHGHQPAGGPLAAPVGPDDAAPRRQQPRQVAVAHEQQVEVREHVQRVDVAQRVVQPPAQRAQRHDGVRAALPLPPLAAPRARPTPLPIPRPSPRPRRLAPRPPVQQPLRVLDALGQVRGVLVGGQVHHGHALAGVEGAHLGPHRVQVACGGAGRQGGGGAGLRHPGTGQSHLAQLAQLAQLPWPCWRQGRGSGGGGGGGSPFMRSGRCAARAAAGASSGTMAGSWSYSRLAPPSAQTRNLAAGRPGRRRRGGCVREGEGASALAGRRWRGGGGLPAVRLAFVPEPRGVVRQQVVEYHQVEVLLRAGVEEARVEVVGVVHRAAGAGAWPSRGGRVRCRICRGGAATAIDEGLSVQRGEVGRVRGRAMPAPGPRRGLDAQRRRSATITDWCSSTVVG